ncbi:MAG: hypothetical protein JL56_12300 [Desulfotomaculum sp. BICA1-6]|nr:MAG: hypothetical protein VR67_17145 [Peptococcaceae bacterium BRH_c8a]KJS72743.1 MAG: hypothetical protein JL56_12300 [Desulfotomaculum sp. BICA1-6]
MILVNKSTGSVIADQVEVAESFARRLRGLMGRGSFPEGSALVLEPCRQVHTFFMRFPIDVIFVNGRGAVLHVMTDVPPRRISPYVRGAQKVVELPAGTLIATDLGKDHILQLIEREG